MNISSIATAKPTLSLPFNVTKIEWLDLNTARITY
jgi:hypothetical protein